MLHNMKIRYVIRTQILEAVQCLQNYTERNIMSQSNKVIITELKIFTGEIIIERDFVRFTDGSKSEKVNSKMTANRGQGSDESSWQYSHPGID